MANINKIRLSGQTYNIQDENASKTVELTQAQYDALVSGGTVDPNTFYVITDAQGADLSNYYTKSETSGATEISTALNAKQDTLVSGTNIKTINNQSLIGEGNIDIQGGGMDDNTQQLIATSLVDLNDRKADKTALSNYQPKGDYATKSELAAKANASEVMTLEKSTKNEQVTASALADLNNKFGGLSLVKITESEYAALTTKDENTLYIVVADPS